MTTAIPEVAAQAHGDAINNVAAALEGIARVAMVAAPDTLPAAVDRAGESLAAANATWQEFLNQLTAAGVPLAGVGAT